MLAQLFAVILTDRYRTAIAKAGRLGDIDTIDAMLDDAEERGALAGDELDRLRELVNQRREALATEKADAEGTSSCIGECQST